MSRDRILEIVAGLVVVGILWSLRQTYDLNAKVSALDSNVTASNSRMDRIATAIPSVAEKVARQDVTTPAKTVVVATRPIEASPNKWESTILVFDIAAGDLTSYSVPLAGQFDKAAYARTTGAALATDRYAQSFRDLETNLRNVQDTTHIADVIVASSSFIFRDASASEYVATFKNVHGPDSARVSRRTFSHTPLTWREINGELARHPDRYQPADTAPTANRDRRY